MRERKTTPVYTLHQTPPGTQGYRKCGVENAVQTKWQELHLSWKWHPTVQITFTHSYKTTLW